MGSELPRDRLAATLAAREAIVRALVEASTLAEAGSRVLEAAGTLLAWPIGVLWEVDDDHGLLRPVAQWAAPGTDVAQFTAVTSAVTFQRGIGLPGRAWEQDAPVWIGELATDGSFARVRSAHETGLRSAMAGPIRGDGGVVGVIEFFSAEPREKDEATIAMMHSVASQVGLYVERRRADVAVQRSRELHAATVAAALDCIVTVDAGGRVVDFNRAAQETFGYTREEAVGAELGSLIVPPELREAHRRGLARAVSTGEARILGKRLELTGMRKDGSRFPAELTVVRIPGPETLFTGFVRDISDRREAEAEVERLLRAEQEARMAAELAQSHSAHVATTLQQSLIPPRLPHAPGLRAAAYFRAAGMYDVGGDFYDMFQTPGGAWAAVIGDVMGKGPQAAAVTALTRYTVRAVTMTGSDPVAAVRTLNRALLDHDTVTQCTLAYALLEPGPEGVHLTLVCGGHPPGLVRRADGRVEELPASGMLLGAFEAPVLRPATTMLAPGETLVLYTDGVTDLRTPDGHLGEERLVEVIAAGPAGPPEAIVEHVRRHTVDVPGHQVHDDVAMLVVGADEPG
jgi:PAS domain S-box-containing protein